MTGMETALLVGALVAGAAATAVSVYGQIEAGKNAVKLAGRNAEILEAEAQAARDARAAEAKFDRQHKFARFKLDQENEAGKTGTSGFEDIFIEDITTFETEQLFKDFNTEVFAYSKAANADVQRFEGAALKQQATIGAIGTGLAGASALMAGGSSLAGKFTTLGGTPVSGGGAGRPIASNSSFNSPGL
jgi:hypothetical protein